MDKQDNKKIPLCVLILITSPKLSEKATKLFHNAALPLHYALSAVGTASSDMMDILGLGSIDKTMLISILPKNMTDEFMRKLKKELKIGTVNSGIAFTISLSGANKFIVRMFEQYSENTENISGQKEATSVSDIKSVMIAAVVNQGYSDEVMNAAKSAGAVGGTVLHSRRIGDEKVMKSWGFGVQEEKEIVLIVTNIQNKLKIMQSISEKCGIRTDAKGTVLSLPIDTVIGLSDEE
ncbi:MAG: hypothetical protein ACI4XP_01090 [Acutalibacteraceae bacterium]